MKEKTSHFHFHWPVIGHEPIIEFLQKSMANQKISHAYLFYGPEHVGKKFVAENFSLSLNCESFQKQKNSKIPCLNCSACEQSIKKIHPDIYFVAGEDGKKISISQVRELEHKLSMRSFLTSYKIAIIEQAELMTIEATNALLKTLEEPTQKTVIILTASNISLLPQTLISRCQLLKFNLVPLKKIESLVSQYKKNKREAREITHLSQGRPGLAYRYLETPQLIEEYKKYTNNILEILKAHSLSERLKIINAMIPKKNDPQSDDVILSITNIWLTITRDLILVKSDNKDRIINIFTQEKINFLAKKYSVEWLRKIADRIKGVEILIKQNINPSLALENLIINL